MTFSLRSVRNEMVAFLNGGPFAPFWRAVMDATEGVDAADLTDVERRWYDDVYELVYMAAEDPVEPRDSSDGLLGAGELRVKLRHRGLDRFGAQPA